MDESESTSPPDPIAQEKELQELCERYQAFSQKYWVADDTWFKEQLRNGTVVIQGIPASALVGKIVAVYNREFVGVGDDEVAMRIELAKQYEMHPGRFVLRYLKKDTTRREIPFLSWGTFLFVFVLVCLACVAAVILLSPDANPTFSQIGSVVEE